MVVGPQRWLSSYPALRLFGACPASCLAAFLCATRLRYFPTMCETSFSFSMQMYSISSVPVTNCQLNFTVQGLV